MSHIAVLLVLLVATMRIGPASAASAWVATCLVTLDVTYSGTVTAMPGSSTTITLDDPGGNFCAVVPGGVVDLTMSSMGPLTLAEPLDLWGCAAGIAAGKVEVDLDLHGFPDPIVDATALNAGGAVEVALLSPDITTFIGAATMVQAPLDTVACIRGTGHTSTSWTGVLAFQDPTLSV